jgi:uncharacterized protein (TIGR03437 family)
MRLYLCLAVLSCLVASSTIGHAQTTTSPNVSTFSYTGAAITIPPANTGISAVAQIYVPSNETIDAVTAQVQITYPNISDLQVYLFSPEGMRTILLQNNCNNVANINTTFDDNAQTMFDNFCPVQAGRGPFKPNQPLGNSKGENAAGYWNLVVTNTNSNTSTGTIQAFSLTLTGNVITTPTFVGDSIVNGASLAGGLIVPGEIASIYGYTLGPQTGVSSSGTPGTSLGGTTVTVNGTPAPILYASYNQINFQVPYTVTPGSTAQIQVTSSTGASGNVSVPVLASAVGLFTNQSNGRGQVLAINQDGTVNSSSNPAAAGSYISLYADGLGTLNQTISAGTPTPNSPLFAATGTVSLIIGGLTTPVQFAGLSPGYIGLDQINVQIPATITAGQHGVFVVLSNGLSSQPGVYLFVQ